MEIRLLGENESDLSKALWEECFCDGARFTDWYHRARTKPSFVLGAFCGKELVSMLHMIPMSFCFGGREERVCLVSGVCTKPEMRRRGICSALFAEAFPIMRERGFAAAVLQPFRTSFYERFGFRTFIYRQRVVIEGEAAKAAQERMTAPGRAPLPSALAGLYAEAMAGRSGYSMRDAEYFKGFIEEYSAKDARLVFGGNGCSAGYIEDGAFNATELFEREGEDPLSFLPAGFAKYVFPLPVGAAIPEGCSASIEEFSMIKPLAPDFPEEYSGGGNACRGELFGFDRY